MTRIDSGRRYSGLESSERAQMRRDALIDAAVELFGTQGYAATTVKQICECAALTERYFYQAFADREDCLVETYLQILDPVRVDTVEAILASGDEPELMAERGLTAFIGALAMDPRKAQIVFIEVVGVSQRLETLRHGMLNEFARLIVNVWLTDPASSLSEDERWLTAVALVGSVQHLFANWLLEGHTRAYEQLVAASSRLFGAVRATL